MAGVLFIVNIPRKEHEDDLKKAKSAKLVMEKEKYEKASKLIRELKTNKRFGNIKSSFESYRGERGLSKCKSTECVHENGDFELLKSKSDNVLNESYKLALSNDCQLRDKSWDINIKQMMKRKKKLRITQPASMTDISSAFHWDTPLEFILSEVITRLNIVNNATWTSTKENRYWQVLFSLDSCYECEELIQVLRSLGIGSRYNSSISVIPCTLYFRASNEEVEHFENDNEVLQSEADSAWTRFSSTVRARANLAQVLHDVRTDAALTFDWLFLLIVAAFVAAIGLVENSTVILVASMLISPLMGPITAGTLGTAVRDRSLQQLGVLHELLGLFLALVIGFIFGLAVCAVDGRYGVGEWPTYEMMTRCEIRSLWVGVLVAIPSGAGVALSVLGENTASLVGVAISASLLPPAVNAGLLWAMALVNLIFADGQVRFTGVVTTYYSSDQPTELAVLGTMSLCLTLVNIACIFVTGVAVYKVKEVCPLERRDILWWRANRKSNQSSKQFFHNNNNNTKWEKYSNFSNDSCKTDLEIKEPVHHIQSDTVTYRRETPAIRRMRAQNIETYCLQKEQFTSMPNNFEANLQDERHIYSSIENLPLKSDITDMRISNDIEKENFYNKERITDLDNVNSFVNAGYEEQENFVNNGFEQSMEKQCPIIEPSSNLTVDPKPRIILGSKSYNV